VPGICKSQNLTVVFKNQGRTALKPQKGLSRDFCRGGMVAAPTKIHRGSLLIENCYNAAFSISVVKCQTENQP
jgi:hypothetical protein